MNSLPERPTMADADRLLAQLDEREVAAGLDVLMQLLRSAADDAAQAEQSAEGDQ